jgi:two-component sensor histidine kinase
MNKLHKRFAEKILPEAAMQFISRQDALDGVGVQVAAQGRDRWRSIWRAGLPPGSGASFVFALICVAIATLARLVLGLVSPDSAVFAPYYSATLVATLIGDASSGLLAAVSGGVLAVWLFVPSDWSLHPFMVEQVVSGLLYAASSAVIILAAESYRCLLQRLRDEKAMRQLLNRELNHRIKNILASVQAIISQTLRNQEDVRETSARIAALAATNDILVKSEWHGASLRDILLTEFKPYDLSHFLLAGDDIECPSEVAIFLALVVHELTTNALKYGALVRDAGRVTVAWFKTDQILHLEWMECGGPRPEGHARQGFGTRLLQAGARQFNGSVEMIFEQSGLCVRLSLTFQQNPESLSTEMTAESDSHHAGIAA